MHHQFKSKIKMVELNVYPDQVIQGIPQMKGSTKKYRDLEREEGKNKRRNDIIRIAEDVFLSKGLAAASMQDIAHRAKISRRTLYRYFQTKEELAFEIVFKIFRNTNEHKKFIDELNGTGLEKISQVFEILSLYFDRHLDEFKFTGVFDYYFTDEYPSRALEDEFYALLNKERDSLMVLIEEGIDDGSIRKNIDPHLISKPIKHSLLSLAQKVAIRGHHLEKEYAFDDYGQAVDFANRVAAIAEKQNHHPDILLTYGKVKVMVWTHKIDALTLNDFIFAAKVETASKA